MIQGTTPKLRLRFPFDARLLDTINVTFVDGSVGTPEIVLTKALTFDIIDSETVDIDIPLIIGGGIHSQGGLRMSSWDGQNCPSYNTPHLPTAQMWLTPEERAAAISATIAEGSLACSSPEKWPARPVLGPARSVPTSAAPTATRNTR